VNPTGDDGQPTHADHEYVLTREDVDHIIGVRYEVAHHNHSAHSTPPAPDAAPTNGETPAEATEVSGYVASVCHCAL
jgi:hypothetical protein